jgi:uncharacterized protein (DUF983 family)
MSLNCHEVEHAGLTPGLRDANKIASRCPFCEEGLLLGMRDQVTFVIQEFDCCTLCGQRVKYSDIADLRAKDWAGKGKS